MRYLGTGGTRKIEKWHDYGVNFETFLPFGKKILEAIPSDLNLFDPLGFGFEQP